jgi:hypothetical protein
METDSDAYMSEPESDLELSDDDFGSDRENVVIPVVKKTTAKGKTVTTQAGKKKNGADTSRKALSNNSNLSNVEAQVTTTKTKSNKTVEEIYQKKTQLEHILLRPDTYSKY